MSGSFAPNIAGIHPGFVAGRYYMAHYPGNPTTGTLSTGFIYYVFYYLPVASNFDRICVNVTTQASAGNTGRLGIYSLSGNTPTSLIVDAGDVAIDSTGAKEATINTSLAPGWYALAFMQSGGTAAFSIAGTSASVAGYVYGTTSVSTTFNSCLRATQSYGSLPSTAPTTSIGLVTGAPIIWLRAA
ncbi:hypothetical protein NIES22_50970 [Calothrix brevissima NIES-22]|nr:hypothetical protein NIES22_50970 [Calothrix brevissima NIES-22]